MKKFSIALIFAAALVPAVFAQSGSFFSSWLIGLFVLIILIMFAIFWFMKNQSPSLPSPRHRAAGSGYSGPYSDSQIGQELPNLGTHSGFSEISSENRPLPKDGIVLGELKQKIKEAKEHGLPEKDEPDARIHAAVDEILQQEFENRHPELKEGQASQALTENNEAEESRLFGHMHPYSSLQAAPKSKMRAANNRKEHAPNAPRKKKSKNKMLKRKISQKQKTRPGKESGPKKAQAKPKKYRAKNVRKKIKEGAASKKQTSKNKNHAKMKKTKPRARK
ncbi:MAG: hypothetical protein V1822_03795 [Candidatus Micrarchaeota archaeon]